MIAKSNFLLASLTLSGKSALVCVVEWSELEAAPLGQWLTVHWDVEDDRIGLSPFRTLRYRLSDLDCLWIWMRFDGAMGDADVRWQGRPAGDRRRDVLFDPVYLGRAPPRSPCSGGWRGRLRHNGGYTGKSLCALGVRFRTSIDALGVRFRKPKRRVLRVHTQRGHGDRKSFCG